MCSERDFCKCSLSLSLSLYICMLCALKARQDSTCLHATEHGTHSTQATHATAHRLRARCSRPCLSSCFSRPLFLSPPSLPPSLPASHALFRCSHASPLLPRKHDSTPAFLTDTQSCAHKPPPRTHHEGMHSDSFDTNAPCSRSAAGAGSSGCLEGY